MPPPVYGLVRVEDLAIGAQVSRVEEDRVGARTTVDVVLGVVHVALAHVDDVVAAAAGDDVDVGDAGVGVGDGVITTAPNDRVVASAPLDRVIAAPAVDRVGADGAGDRVGLLAAVAGDAAVQLMLLARTTPPTRSRAIATTARATSVCRCIVRCISVLLSECRMARRPVR